MESKIRRLLSIADMVCKRLELERTENPGNSICSAILDDFKEAIDAIKLPPPRDYKFPDYPIIEDVLVGAVRDLPYWFEFADKGGAIVRLGYYIADQASKKVLNTGKERTNERHHN